MIDAAKCYRQYFIICCRYCHTVFRWLWVCHFPCVNQEWFLSSNHDCSEDIFEESALIIRHLVVRLDIIYLEKCWLQTMASSAFSALFFDTICWHWNCLVFSIYFPHTKDIFVFWLQQQQLFLPRNIEFLH